MFTYQTSSYLIIGLKSLHPLIRLVHENHFTRIAVVFEKNRFNWTPQEIRKLISKIETNEKQKCLLYPVDIRSGSIKILDKVDLIISYGTRVIHDIAKQSNHAHVAIYSIETDAGHMSSYGTGIVWKKHQTAWKSIIPDVVFNSCYRVHRWDINDLLYFLHDIPLALEAAFNAEQPNDFIITCAFSGILQILKYYKLIKNMRNPRKLRKLYKLLAQADILTKNAYNNVTLSSETKKIAEAIQHYRQFEVVSAYESLDMVNNQIRRHGARIEKILKYLKTSLSNFQKDFDEMYSDFINHPKRWETCGDILGKKLIDVMGKNQQTRRLM